MLSTNPTLLTRSLTVALSNGAIWLPEPHITHYVCSKCAASNNLILQLLGLQHNPEIGVRSAARILSISCKSSIYHHLFLPMKLFSFFLWWLLTRLSVMV